MFPARHTGSSVKGKWLYQQKDKGKGSTSVKMGVYQVTEKSTSRREKSQTGWPVTLLQVIMISRWYSV